MKVKMPSLRRQKYGLTAVLLLAAVAVPALTAPKAFAYGQVTSRSITMSSSAAGATSQTYEIKFTTTSTTAVRAVVIDFCAESPIIGETDCTLPTGMTVGSSSLSTTNLSSTGTWSASVANSRTLTISNATADTTGEAAARTVSVGGFTNPTDANETFYARILTYSSNTTGYGNPNAGTIGSPLDAGGIALSTTNAVSVSGTVQETLTFCVSGSAPGANCSSLTDPTLALGHGDPKVLDANFVDTANAYSQVTTNAGAGVSIKMKNSNTCTGLSKDGGTTCEIAGVASSGSAVAIAAGDEVFGVRVASSGGTGTVASQGAYASGTNYGMDADVNSTYGDEVASSSGVVDQVNTTYTFAATAGNTTPAGVYTATMVLIATGTY